MARNYFFSNLELSVKKYKGEFHTSEEWAEIKEMTGAKKLKEALFGFGGKKKIKSLDEMAEILVDCGVCTSLEDGKKMIPQFYGQNISYGKGHMSFERVEGVRGDEGIRVERYS